jgi:hypothetical protein
LHELIKYPDNLPAPLHEPGKFPENSLQGCIAKKNVLTNFLHTCMSPENSLKTSRRVAQPKKMF